ncbi:MAG TPA: SprT family zinc-dependent metalloprotease [Acetobacteraceae bacterium]|nr:SprT family zinc-dependent metalloprotease [Acetobacteraceae bacterium]
MAIYAPAASEADRRAAGKTVRRIRCERRTTGAGCIARTPDGQPNWLTNRLHLPFVGRMEWPRSETLTLPSGPTRVEWRRNHRARRVSLRIDPCGGGVVVTLPIRAGRGAGVALLMNHAEWVASRLAALPDALPFVDGTLVPIGDVPHRIRHVPQLRGGAWLQDGELHVSGAPEFLRRRVIDFLRAEALRRLSALVVAKTATLGVTARRISVKDTRSRWGSCASDGSLAFSWRLVMTPEFVQDYVAAHEVAHLKHLNHGKRFWRLVDRLTPHAATAIPWLQAEGFRLLRVG